MKKVLMSALLALSTLSLCAQPVFFSAKRADKFLNVGIHAGFDISNLYFDGYIYKDLMETEPDAGLLTGVMLDFNIIKSISIRTGIDFMQRQQTCSLEQWWYFNNRRVADLDTRYDIKLRSYWMDIPVMATYHLILSPKFQVQAGIGGFFSAGLNGQISVTEEYHGLNDYNYPVKFKETGAVDYFHEGNFKRFDCGMMFSLGIQFKSLYAAVQIRQGLVNQCKEFEPIKDDKQSLYDFNSKDESLMTTMNCVVGFTF